MLTGQTICDANGHTFCDVFRFQYVLFADHVDDTPGWMRKAPLMGRTLTHCPNLDCQTLQDSNGTPIGWFLGIAVDETGTVVSKTGLTFPAAATDSEFWQTVETHLEHLAGKFVAIVLTETDKRLYMDPVCDLPAVFNAEERLVAASPLLALRRDVQVNPRLDYNAVLSEGGNYGMQQTCDPSVLRMKSNHYLDLDDFTLHRHWPKEDTFDGTQIDVETYAAMAAKRISQICSGLLSSYTCNLPISGGNDSRFLAYAMKPHAAKIALLYSHHVNWVSRIDCYLGAQIANDLGARFLLVEAQKRVQSGEMTKPDIRQARRLFHWRIGFIRAPRPTELAAHVGLPECDIALRANILDIAGANQWQRGNYVFDLDHAISKLRIAGRTPEENAVFWRQDYINWMETVPENAKPYMYEMAFSELLLPNTLGASLMGYGTPNYVNPFNDRRLISKCMTVDPALRKRGKLYNALHRAVRAPRELLRTPAYQNDPDKMKDVDAFFAPHNNE